MSNINYYQKYKKYKLKYIKLKQQKMKHIQHGGKFYEKRIEIKLRPYFILDNNEFTDTIETGSLELADKLNYRFIEDTLDIQGFLGNIYKVIGYNYDINKSLLYITLEKKDAINFIEKDFVNINNLFDPYNTEPDAWSQWNIIILSEDEFKTSEIYKDNHKVELGLDVIKIDFV